MIKIITAMGNPSINVRLRETNKYIIQAPDIEFEDDLLDIIKNKPETNILILNLKIIKNEKNIIFFINKIKLVIPTIKIIVILEHKNEKIEKFLMSQKNINIFFRK